VVIASGGFQGNVEMMTRYAGANAVFARPFPRAASTTRVGAGDDAGSWGSAAGQYDMFHGAPSISFGSGRGHRRRDNFGILVDSQGRRFIDEGTNLTSISTTKLPGPSCVRNRVLRISCFDGSLFDIPHVRSRIQTEVEPVARGVDHPASPRHCRCPRKL